MNYATSLKIAAASALMALLSACGGGSGGSGSSTPDKPLPEVAWGSPAVFVTPGQASSSFAMTGCILSAFEVPEAPVYQAKLVISAAGDMSIEGTTSNAASATTSRLASMTFADASYVNWRAVGTVETPTYSIEMSKPYVAMEVEEGEPGEPTAIRVGGLQNSANSVFSYEQSTGTQLINCELTQPLVLKAAINQARVAKHMGSGVSEIDTRALAFLSANNETEYTLPSGVSGDLANWSSPEFIFINETPFPQQNYQFNLVTGSFKQSMGTDTTAPLTEVNSSLPSSANGESVGVYHESVCRNASFYESKEAKSLIAARIDGQPSIATLANTVFATRYGNKLMPLHILFALVGLQNERYGPKADCLPLNAFVQGERL
jgi:hypothetical protein